MVSFNPVYKFIKYALFHFEIENLQQKCAFYNIYYSNVITIITTKNTLICSMTTKETKS